jgi:hypothetical protein
MTALAVAGSLLPAFAGTAPASAAAAGGIHPGVTVTFGGVSCTSGPILRQGSSLYVAIPASCGGIDAGKVQDGCVEPETPVGVPVRIGGAKHRGLLVYNSFSWMQLHGVRNANRCYYDDLALVRVNKLDRSRVSGRIPGRPAPHRVAGSNPSSGSSVRIGSSTATAGASGHGGWELDVTLTGAKPAQIGSAAVQGSQIVGMLTSVPQGLLPAGPSGVYSLHKELAQLRHVPGFRHITLLAAGAKV